MADASRNPILAGKRPDPDRAGLRWLGRLLALTGVSLALGAGSPAARTPAPIVYAWFPARFGSWPTDGLHWECLTHLCFRSVELTADGSLRLPTPRPPSAFVDTVHRHSVRLTVLVWLASADDSDGYLARAPQEAAASLLRYVQENHLDGVNIDDERMREINSVSHTPNRDLVTRFFRILSRTFKRANPRYHVTFAAPPIISSADRYGVSWLDLKGIAEAVDGIIPMGYTMNPPSIGWSTNPEPLAGGGKSAATTTRDLETMVHDYLAAMGGRRANLLPGVSVSFGGNEWRCRADTRLSPTLGKSTPKSLAECEEQVRQHGRRWDEAQQSPWYCYAEGNAFVQGWYNDPQAWQAKLAWIRAQGLGGIGLWVLDGVNDAPERWKALQLFRSAPSALIGRPFPDGGRLPQKKCSFKRWTAP